MRGISKPVALLALIAAFIYLRTVCDKDKFAPKQPETPVEQAVQPSEKQIAEQRPAISQDKPIPPDHCRIIGTVVRIDSTRSSTDPNDPLSKYPGRAVVQVDSVLGYGMAFAAPVGKGKEITIIFRFTLAPTKGLFPNMTEEYPGLAVGSQFLADVESQPVMDIKQRESILLTVYGYTVLDKK